ncbi:MAG TPA: GAF domain-containing protein [Phototrophicaceae bacterium]|nr:GAF domain-containing protein [Phototrophicaceae bacterium]
MKLTAKLVILILIVSLLPTAIMGLIGLQSTNQISSTALQESTDALKKLGETLIEQKAEDVAGQVALYLKAHPDLLTKSPQEWQSDPELLSIAVQTVGETGYTIIHNTDAIMFTHPDPSLVGTNVMREDLPDLLELTKTALTGTNAEGYYKWEEADKTIRDKFIVFRSIENTSFILGATIYIDEFYQPIQLTQQRINRNAQDTQSTVLGGIIIVSIVAISVGLGFTIRSIVRPLNQVSEGARAFSSGQFDQKISVSSHDEIGELAATFNQMARSLQEIYADFESRIATRTRDMETAVQVNAQISTILDPNRLLQDVVDLTKERFRLYHAHIYLLDESQQNLVLTAGAGHVGRQMVSEKRQIELSNPQSIVAQAARGHKGVIINDVTTSPTFLSNPLLPDTQAELAVPLIARGQLLGVLDVQSNQVGYFNTEVLAVMELMAGQIATAISNAQLYEVAERTSRHEKALGNVDRRIQGAVDMDEILQTTVRELGKALRVPYTAIELQLTNEDSITTGDSHTK